MAAVVDNLMTKIAEPSQSSGNKITVVGVGQVGMACAFSILTQVCSGLGSVNLAWTCKDPTDHSLGLHSGHKLKVLGRDYDHRG